MTRSNVQYRYAYTNMMKLHLEKIEKVEQVKFTTADNDFQEYELLIQIQGGRLLGLPGGGAGAFPLPDQVVQRGHRSDGETFQNKTEADLHKTYSSSRAPTGAQERPARETSKTQMFSMTTRCLGCQGFSLNK